AYNSGSFYGIPATPFQVAAFSGSGNIIWSGSLLSTTTSIPFSPDISAIRIYDEQEFIARQAAATPVFEAVFSMCNKNGVCDSCYGLDCETIENFVTCPSDCPSGSNDSYCDLKRDKVCDPDCPGMDGDCDGCGEFCTFDDATCDSLGGTLCLGDALCEGGRMAFGLMEDGVPVDDCCIEGGKCQVEGFIDESTLTEEDLEFLDADIDADMPGAESITEDGDTPGAPMTYGEMQEDSERIPLTPEDLIMEEEGPDILANAIVIVVLLLVLAILMIIVRSKSPAGVHSEKTIGFVRNEISALYAKGLDRDQIRQALIGKGYPKDLIDREIDRVFSESSGR
ncbi:TPA: hypothetical protein HA265_05000, partial [Candidatus Woesearchaeota archaeon]|nr:hypothetical protein [Candidatus Woesearchaeota archaeon]